MGVVLPDGDSLLVRRTSPVGVWVREGLDGNHQPGSRGKSQVLTQQAAVGETE